MCYFGDSTRPPGFRNNFKTFYSFGWNNGCDEARRAVMLLPFQLCACVEQHTLLLGCYCQRAALPANDDRTKRINCAKWYKFFFLIATDRQCLPPHFQQPCSRKEATAPSASSQWIDSVCMLQIRAVALLYMYTVRASAARFIA
jgi:hypothetical protein